MNERIKELAEQAGMSYLKHISEEQMELVERFAELVRQDEREQISHTYLKLTLDAVLREREANAKLCDDIDVEYQGEDVLATWCAAAIRARSNHETT